MSEEDGRGERKRGERKRGFLGFGGITAPSNGYVSLCFFSDGIHKLRT